MPATLLLSWLLLAALAAATEAPRPECSGCGMWIDQYMRVRFVVTLGDGKTETFCSIACAAKFIQEHEVVTVMAADFNTAGLTDAMEAYFVIGSDVPPVMSATSTVAFASRADASGFIKRHKGRIARYNEAIRENLK